MHLKFKILILYSWILFTTILRKVMTKNENSRPSGTCSIRKAEFDNFVLYKAFKNSCEIPQNPDFDAQLFKSSTLLSICTRGMLKFKVTSIKIQEFPIRKNVGNLFQNPVESTKYLCSCKPIFSYHIKM